MAGQGLGLAQLYYGEKALKDLNKTPYMYATATPYEQNAIARSEEMALHGLTPAQKAEFGNNLNQSITSGYRNATQLGGGNLAQTTGASLNATKANAYVNLAAQDAIQKQNNIKYANSQDFLDQTLQNEITRQHQARKTRMEDLAYGQINAGTKNIVEGNRETADNITKLATAFV